MNVNIKKIIFIFIYVLLKFFSLLAIGLSAMIYTSLDQNLPWYEPCGMQFLVVLIFCFPLLIITGLGEIFLSRYRRTTRLSKILPFVISIMLVLPIFICGALNRGMQIAGIGIAIIAVALLAAETAFNLRIILKEKGE